MVKLKHLSQWLIVLLAILLPFLIIRSFPKFFHSSDVDDFWRWSQAWSTDWHSIYVNCERCNYPFIGTFLSAGIMNWINIENFNHLASRFRYYLACVDALNVLTTWFILMRLQVKNAPLWAGLIGLLPSSWLGSSVWGQVDGLGQLLILSFLGLLIWFNSKERPKEQYYQFVFFASLLLSLMVLTKQLIYFSIFALGILFLANITLYIRKFIDVAVSVIAAVVVFITPIFAIDKTLVLKKPYLSHLQYILATGSHHGDKISYTGFNIWVFFAADPIGSSHIAIPFQIGTKTIFSVIPYSAGIFLFLIVNMFLLFMFANYILKQYLHEVRFFNKTTLLFSFTYLALVNLSFNLTLAGTHERYLYHFYPFIIIACLGLIDQSIHFNRTMLTTLFVGAITYGVFLLGYLALYIRPSSQATLQIYSMLNLLLFSYLVYSTIREFSARTPSILSST